MFFSKTSLGLRAALFVLFLATLLFAVFPGTVDRLQPLQRAIVRAGNEQQAEYDFHWQYKRLPGETPAEKGRRLNCLMSADIAHAQVLNKGVPVESTVEEFIEVSDLNEEGWIKTDDQPHYGSTGLPNTLQQLTGASYSSLHYDMIRHHQYGMRGNIPIGPTQGYFGNGITIQGGGVLIADSNRVPRKSPGFVPEISAIPTLEQWSQAAYGQWAYFSAANDGETANLRWIIRSWITNNETQAVVFDALRNANLNQIPNFANRKVFSRTSENENDVDGFYAILGSPNGSGGAFLLATHKEAMGIKRFSSVAVWNHPFASPMSIGDINLKLMLAFEIENVQNPTTDNP